MAASSSVITSIDSALRDLESRAKLDPSLIVEWKKLKIKLRNFKVFLFTSRKLLGNDGDLQCGNKDQTLLASIGSAVRRYETEIGFYSGGEDHSDMRKTIYGFLHGTRHLEKEIDEWYVTMSIFLSADEVVEITDLNLENIVDFLALRLGNQVIDVILVEQMNAMAVFMTFLKNLLCFACVENRGVKDLLIHSSAVAIEAARIFIIATTSSSIWYLAKEKMHNKCSMLIQSVKPIDPQVYVTYSQALKRLDSSSQDMHDDRSVIVLKNFVDSLVAVLWDGLREDNIENYHLAPVKNPRQVLFDGLRFLRTTLKLQPNSFDEEIWDRVRVLVCDAGVLLCSFYYQTLEDIDPGLQDFLERIKVFRVGVEEKLPQMSSDLGFADSLLENLMEMTSCNAELTAKSCVQTIRKELVLLRSLLGEAMEFCNEQEELQTLCNRVSDVAYKIEFLIDWLAVRDISDLSDPVMEDIRDIKTYLLRISHGKRKGIEVNEEVKASTHDLPPQSTLSITNEVIGFHDEATSIIHRLTRGSTQLQVVAIWGMAGLGKTTLASKVYNDPTIMCHFHVRAWCPVSQVLDRQKVLIELLNQIDPESCDSKMAEQDLVQKVWRCLKGKRYLIYLDDVWTVESWNSLEESFPKEDSFKSRIILTTRDLKVAHRAMHNEEPHPLRPLTDDESLELLQRKLFHGKGWPPALHELGMRIIESCKGLPLTIVIVAGLLATMEQESWEKILEGLSSGIASSAVKQCMKSLELSYKYLPNILKQCFLYFGAFPEDQEVSTKRLIRLWIAEGFVRKTSMKRLEDVAEGYLVDLIERSLVMVAKQRSIGGPKTCRIHDLLYEFCLTKAKQENFFHILRGNDELLDFNEPACLRRLCIYSDPKHFEESKLFCPRARSLLFFSATRKEWLEQHWSHVSFVIHIFKLLKVLDLEQIHSGDVIPSELGLLVLLKYLAIRGAMKDIPSSIGNLSNLETLIVDPEGQKFVLPHSLWSLQKLKFLYMRSYSNGGGILPYENLENSPDLHELEILSGVVFPSYLSMKKQMRKFPNIRRLKCNLGRIMNTPQRLDEFVVPKSLALLESLHLIGDNAVNFSLEFVLPANITRLTLSDFKLPWEKLSTIGKLPHLRILKLLNRSFSGKKWEMKEGEFSELTHLKLCGLDIVRWTASDDQFSDLQSLVLDRCKYLKEIPSCFETIPTLEMIEVSRCSDVVASLAGRIKEEQAELGNSSIKISIQSCK